MASRTFTVRIDGDEDHLRVLDHLLAYHQRYEGVRDAILTDLVRDAQVELHIVPGSYSVPDPGSELWITDRDVMAQAQQSGVSANGVSKGFRGLVRLVLSLQQSPPQHTNALEELLLNATVRTAGLYMITELSLAPIFADPQLQVLLRKRVRGYGVTTHGVMCDILRARGHIVA